MRGLACWTKPITRSHPASLPSCFNAFSPIGICLPSSRCVLKNSPTLPDFFKPSKIWLVVAVKSNSLLGSDGILGVDAGFLAGAPSLACSVISFWNLAEERGEASHFVLNALYFASNSGANCPLSLSATSGRVPAGPSYLPAYFGGSWDDVFRPWKSLLVVQLERHPRIGLFVSSWESHPFWDNISTTSYVHVEAVRVELRATALYGSTEPSVNTLL